MIEDNVTHKFSSYVILQRKMYYNVLINAIQKLIMKMNKEVMFMATKSANVMARVEPTVKAKAEAIMSNLGLPASVVINALYHQIIYTNGIPFPLSIPSNVLVEDNMSREEFNSILDESIKQAENGEGVPVDEAFEIIRKRIKR